MMEEKPIQEELHKWQDKEHITEKYAESEWYADIVHFLLHLQCHVHLVKKIARSLKLKAIKYLLINQQLHWKDLGGVLLRRLEKPEIEEVISELHECAHGGHKYWKSIAYKILRSGYYWTSLFSDVYQ